jgi:hypothetical protein
MKKLTANDNEYMLPFFYVCQVMIFVVAITKKFGIDS